MSERIAQAGAIAFKTTGGPHILLVRAKQNPQHWIFPKGHIEPGETVEEAARRELLEEAGVIGELVAHVGYLEFQTKNEQVHVDYFLFRYAGTSGPGEGREPRWCSYDEAMDMIIFPDTRELLTDAMVLIREQPHDSGSDAV